MLYNQNFSYPEYPEYLLWTPSGPIVSDILLYVLSTQILKKKWQYFYTFILLCMD